MSIDLPSGIGLSTEEQENLERVRQLVRRVARMPEQTVSREQARLLLKGVATAKYRRISKHRADPYGPLTQDEDILSACESEGFEVPQLDYEDHISASGRLIRWDFERMLDDARAGKFKLLVVGRVDRFARNLLEGQLYLLELRLIGVYVYFCDEEVVAGLDHNWREIVERKLNDAQGHLRIITQNNRKTAEKRRKRGRWNGPTPFGWRLSEDRKTLLQDPKEWPVVERMIQLLREDEKSLQDICEQLWLEGHRTRQGRRIKKHLIWQTLKHPVLKGCWPVYAYGSGSRRGPGYREVKKAEGPLSDAEFDQLKQLMTGRYQRHQNVSRVKHDYVFRNVLRCGEIIREHSDEQGNVVPARVCGLELLSRSMRRVTGQTYQNYRHPEYAGCSPNGRGWMVSERHLVAQLDQLFERASLPEDASRVIGEFLAQAARTATIDRATLRARFQAEMDRIDAGYKAGLYGDYPETAIPLWKGDRNKVLAKMAQLPQEREAPRPHETQRLVDLPQIWAAANGRERRQVLRALFTAVYVTRDDEGTARRRVDGHQKTMPRIRCRARLARIEPRVEYAELIAYAFRGVMSDDQPAGRHGSLTTFGDDAKRFLGWLRLRAA